MIASVSYSDVKKAAKDELGYTDDDYFYTGTKELRHLAANYGIELGKRRRPFKSFDFLPETSILAINYKEKEETWHWVVYRNTGANRFVYDPKRSIKTNKRTDFNRMRPKWHIPVINT